MELSNKTKDELIKLCKENKIKGYSAKKKEDIIKLLQDNLIECPKEDKLDNIIIEDTDYTVPTFIEVCAGCGGLSTGFIQAGFKPILINEIESTFCETLKENHPGENIINSSMLDLDLSKFKGKVDILQGGVPCQAFSHAGERKGLDDPRGQLIVQFNNLINQCEPKVFLVENVKGLITHNEGETLKDIIKLFENNGLYNVQYKLLNAKDYNVPQKRERIFIIGTKNTISKTFNYPPKADKEILLKDVLVDVPPSIGAKYPKHKEDIMKLVPQGGCWVDLPEEIKIQYMGQSLNAGGGKRGIARRLAMDEQSLTLTTSPCQKQTERCHPIETRPLNVREYARIQTFPDDYIFKGSMANQYKQIGNAVPVNLAMAMAKSIKEFLNT
jgi:DNA (cytosine-5)-methyltransferase 1